MKAKINHLTILSEDNYALGRFYEGFFHMRPAGAQGALDDVRIGDGRIGLNIKPRVSGHAAQLDHFGIEVDDIEQVFARIRESYPKIAWLENPSGRAFPSISTHDPDGNVFGIFQTGKNNSDEIYEVEGRQPDRIIDHIALRVLHPQKVAEFYVKVFDLTPLDKPSGGKNVYLSDGNVILVIIPWRLGDFEKTGISARGLDHIGFKVESITALKSDIQRVTEKNYRFQPRTSILGQGNEGMGRLEMFRNACPLGCHHMADSDGLLIDVRE
jgi:catechol 2,3-dioxygenase-like lactoylglutathione lyase family enzyme